MKSRLTATPDSRADVHSCHLPQAFEQRFPSSGDDSNEEAETGEINWKLAIVCGFSESDFGRSVPREHATAGR